MVLDDVSGRAHLDRLLPVVAEAGLRHPNAYDDLLSWSIAEPSGTLLLRDWWFLEDHRVESEQEREDLEGVLLGLQLYRPSPEAAKHLVSAYARRTLTHEAADALMHVGDPTGS